MIIRLKNRTIIKIDGKDRFNFLQGLITNNVNKVKAGALYTAFLSPQGKFLFDFFMVEKNDSIYITPEVLTCDDLFKKLKIYKLRSDVILTLLDDWAVYADMTADKMADLPSDTEIVFTDPRNKAMGRLILTKDTIDSSGLMDNYDKQRIDLGIPDGSRDMPIDKAIILENGLDELQAIDWEKGCYLGQELMARTKHRGMVRKKLMTVKLDGVAPENGEVLFVGDKKIGTMRTSCGAAGLALLRIEMAEKVMEDAGEIKSESGKIIFL